MNKNSVREKCTLPNCITMFRIVGTVGLIFTKPFSWAFYIIYTLCGLSDVVDGWVARKTGRASDFGAKLDSVADLCYYAVMALMILPVLWETLPVQIWYAVGGVLVIRVITYVMVAVRHHRFASMHTYGNKLTGAGVFAIPYFIEQEIGVAYCIVACTVSVLATIEEFLIHLFSKEYNPKCKTILQMGK